MSDLSFAPGQLPGILTRRQKAAVVIHLLISGGVDPGLSALSPDQQRRLVRDLTSLRFVDRRTLAGIVAEFATELDGIGLHFPSDPGRVLAALDGRLSLDVVEAVAAELGLDGIPGEGPWTQVATLGAPTILAMMEAETDEVCAIMMSKLPAGLAAELMATLPDGRADAIAAAFARTEDVTPEAVARIGMALGRQSLARRTPAFASDPVRRVGEILNVATGGVRRSILESLDATDAEFAARVRAVIFSFENIPDRIAPRDVPRILRGVANDVVVTALAGLPDEMGPVADFILDSISKRMAEQIREEMAERETVPVEAAEEAMAAIVAEIRRMEEAGDLVLQAADA